MSLPDFALTALRLKATQILIRAAREEEPTRSARSNRAKNVIWPIRQFKQNPDGTWFAYGLSNSGRHTSLGFERDLCDCPDSRRKPSNRLNFPCKHKISMAYAILNYKQNEE